MSLRCVGNQLLETVPCALLTGVSTASLSIWVRVNSGSNVTDSRGVQLFGDDGGKLAVALSAAGELRASWSANDGVANHTSSWNQSLVPDVNYHLAVTWQDGAQRYYLNGLQVGADAQRGALGKLGDTAPYLYRLGPDLAGVDVTIDEPTLWVGYALTAADVGNLRDRVVGPSTISPASIALRWTLAGPDGVAAAPGDAGLTDGSTTGLNLSKVTGGAPIYRSGTLAYSLLDHGCSPMVAPSGEALIFEFIDAATNPSYVTNVVDNNEEQSITISGQPTGGAFKLTFGGQATPPIPTTAAPPLKYAQWNPTLAAAGTYDLAVNLHYGGDPFTHAGVYDIFDGSTKIATATLDTNNPSNNPTHFPDPTLKVRAGYAVEWFSLGRHTFTGTAVHVRLSCSATAPARFYFDNLRVATADGATVVLHQPDKAIVTEASLGQDDATGGSGDGFQLAANAVGNNAIQLDGLGAGNRYLADPLAVQNALAALPSIGAGNVAVTGDGSAANPLLAKFIGSLAGTTQPLITCADGTISVARVATGGVLPSISINGGPSIALDRDWLFYNSLVPSMPTVSFHFPKSPPAATYSGVGQYDNTINGGGWDTGIGGGYVGQTRQNASPGATASYYFRPAGPGQFRVSATWPHDPTFSSSVTYTIQTTSDVVCPPVLSNGATQYVTGAIRKISHPGPVVANLNQIRGTVISQSVTIYGADGSGAAISETLPAFSSGVTSVVGTKSFAAVTSIVIPSNPPGYAAVSFGTIPRMLGTYTTDQTVAPSGAVDRGVPWQVLDTFTFTGRNDGLTVTQSNGTSTRMVADALRFERISPDTSIKINPGDTVGVTWGAGWATCQYGAVAAQTTPIVAQNLSGGKIVSGPATTSTMKMGFNIPMPTDNLAVYYYENLARHTGGVGDYPSGLSTDSSISMGITVELASYGGENKTWPNVPAGDYILMWDGANNAEITTYAGSMTEHTGSASITGTTDNKRVYTLGADANNYGPYYIRVLAHGTPSGSKFNYDITNIRIYPADVDLASPPRFRADFLAKLANQQVSRWLDVVCGNQGNAVDFAHYQKSDALLSKNIPIHIYTSNIASIRNYTGTAWNYQVPGTNAGGVDFLITTKTPHNISDKQYIQIQNYSGPPAQLINGEGITGTYDFNNTFAVASYVDATSFLIHPGYNQGPHVGFRMTNVLTDPSPGAIVYVQIQNAMNLDDQVAVCNAANLDYYFNTSFTNSDACLTALGTYFARNLKPGLKLRVECSNETWNFFQPPFYVAELRTNSPDETKYSCDTAAHHWGLMKAAWTAAGRDPNDFIRVMGSQYAVSSKTAARAAYCHANGIMFEEVAIGMYLNNQPAYTRPVVPETGFSPVIDRMTVEQQLDMWEMHYVYGGYEGLVPGHKDAVTGRQPDGTHLYPEFLGVNIIAYEGGPDFMKVVGGTGVNDAYTGHAINRHPRYYNILMHIFGLFAKTGLTAFHDYQLASYDAPNAGNLWSAYVGTAQLPYTPGNPTQDAIQINNSVKLDQIQSITGGAIKAFGALYNAKQPSSPTTATLTPTATNCRVGVESGAIVINLDAVAPAGGTVVNLMSSIPGDVFHGTIGGGPVASIAMAPGSATGSFYLVAGTAGPRNISISSPGLATVGSPLTIAAAASTTSPTKVTVAATPTTSKVGAESAAIVVTLDAAAPAGGTVVSLTSSGASDVFHGTIGGGPVASIAIAPGSATGSFYLVAGTAGPRNISISSPGLATVGSPLTIAAATSTTTATMATLAPTPTRCIPGVESATIVVTLDAAAPAGGTVVNLMSSIPGDVFHGTIGGGPVASIAIAPGSATGSFYLVAGTAGPRDVSIASPGLKIVGSPLTITAKKKHHRLIFRR